jgi:DNA processing protein
MKVVLSENELAYWLVVIRIPGLGPKRFASLRRWVGDLSNCFNDKEPRRDFLRWCQEQSLATFTPDWQGVEKDLRWAQGANNHILTWHSQDYPGMLKEISSAPPVLFVKGSVESINTTQIAMVGSRQATTAGKKNAYQFGFELAEHGFTITSGLALGIDGASHEGALKAGGKTIAVLGNSLEQIYPSKHKALAVLIEENGALVSEFPIGTSPRAEHFPQRNRIISGLSVGVVVIESAIKSGSLITANYALDQGREIFALPGDISNPMAKGCHQLIRHGAKCVDSIEHIMEEFPALAGLPHQRQKEQFHQTHSLVPKSVMKEELPSLSLECLAHIFDVCTSIDSVVDRTGLTVTEVSQMLLELELQGMVASVPGGYIRIGTGG